MLTPADLQSEMIRLSRLLDQGIDYLTEAAVEYAETDNAYRMARAKALLESEGTVSERNAQADLATSKERVAARLADGMKQAALEAVRSRRQQLSALQSLAAAYRAEVEHSKYGPQDGP